MSRSGVWEYVIGFAAGLLGGDLGVVGAHVWDDWRNKSDQEFLQSFSSAVDQFAQAAFSFMQNTESVVVPVLDQILSEFAEHSEAVNSGLERLVRRGVSIEPVFRALHYPDSDQSVVDDDVRQFLEIVLNNLRENGLSYDSERNIREICGISEGG